ncbi:MAG: hypothetical protein P1Q69_03915 [Candidatus Thorarchaeota archaeon]|nr:hypothetical protein [Candidatus Thorarchaeota archaeon]
MLEKILTKGFRRLLEATFDDIKNQQDRRDEEEFAKDEVRIKEDLLDTVDPHPANAVLDEDFFVAAVDGSGNSNLVTLDDIRVHLLSSSTILLDTNSRNGQYFEPISREIVEAEIGEQPHLDSHWHSGVRGDAQEKLAQSLESIYPQKDITEIILPFFRDFTNGSISSTSDIGKSIEYGKYVNDLKRIDKLISRQQLLTNPVVHDELRTVTELAAVRKVLESNLNPKYVLIDGALSVFLHFVRKYPSMPSGFMLRDVCSLARKKGVTVAAVSKNHTIPFAHRIANMARDNFGSHAKWFCQLPSADDPGGGLHIYEDRTYIPPTLAVPYLFSFSRDNRPSRVDFDRIWWREKIYVPNDPVATRANEKDLFSDLEFMSRDARWYGYPVALGLAHETCKMSYEDLRLAREIVEDILRQIGQEGRKAAPLREDYNL